MMNLTNEATFAAAVAVLSGSAMAGGPIVDSTRVPTRSVTTLNVPEGTPVRQEYTLIDQFFNLGGALPPGYTQYTLQAGPHAGASKTYPDKTYASVTYLAPLPSASPSQVCGSDTSPRVLYFAGTYTTSSSEQGSTTVFNNDDGYITCEPTGSVTQLVNEETQATQSITLTSSDINTYAKPGTIGVNTSGATPICQAKGYTNFTYGSITGWDRGSGCSGDTITQYSNGSWVTDSACYNFVMTGVQCYK
jgi:hypothetical protein